MSASEQMRAAWSRRTDDELLRAFFLEELTHEGRCVVTDLVVENYGPVDAFLRSFELEQGDLVATLPVRGLDVAPCVKDRKLPVMWGDLVLSSEGVGFIPRGHEDDTGADDLNELGDIAFGIAGRVVGSVGDAIRSDLKRTMHPVPSRAGVKIPLPILAKLEPNALWLPHATYDHVLWGPDFGELVRAGVRLLALRPATAAADVVASWAATYGIALTSVAPAPLFRSDAATSPHRPGGLSTTTPGRAGASQLMNARRHYRRSGVLLLVLALVILLLGAFAAPDNLGRGIAGVFALLATGGGLWRLRKAA